MQVARAEPVPPHPAYVLAEPRRLDVTTAQVQPPHLVDDEAAQGRVGRVEEAALGLQVLQRQVVDRVEVAAIRVTGIGLGQQDVDRVPVGQERVLPVLPELTSGDGLDHPVHLDLVPGPVQLDQRQPVHLGGRGPEPGRGGEKLAQPGRVADGPGMIQAQFHGDRLGREERAEVEQVHGVGGQQRGRHRPRGRDRRGEFRGLLAEQPVRVLLEAAEIAVHAMTGLGQVGGGVLDRDGQMSQRLGQASRLADTAFVLAGRARGPRRGGLPGGAGS